MARKYSEKLVEIIREKQFKTTLRGVEVIMKPIPDSEMDGAMDPRLLEPARKMFFIMKMLPKGMFKISADAKSVERMRKPFNHVDSTPVTLDGVKEEMFTVTTKDGYSLPLTKFTSVSSLPEAPILYYIHGGGFFAGHTGVVAEALRMLVKNTGIIAVSVDYRLAPEYPFPTGHQDCYEGLNWVYEHAGELGGDPDNIFVAGDSAGGNLTLYCANRNIEDKKNMIKGQIILYPTVNMAGIQDEYTKFSLDEITVYDKHRKYILPGIQMFMNSSSSLFELLGTSDTENIYLTPYLSVSDKMPPTMITSGEHDFLTIEALAYARKLIAQGIDTTVTIYRGMGHAYFDHVGNYPQSEDCVIDIGNFILEKSGRSQE